MPSLSVAEIERFVDNLFSFPADTRPHVTLHTIHVPFPRPEQFWGRPVVDAFTIREDPVEIAMPWERDDWYMFLCGRDLDLEV
ncbi:hypothetical protein AURDEDRAFT_116312 [Auricularia subglabra TFB-10046 SS5]|nr:hypothetical protein AURDEDRAFT_116312 [Auricularia subglabra TFB-10046 SS5]